MQIRQNYTLFRRVEIENPSAKKAIFKIEKLRFGEAPQTLSVATDSHTELELLMILYNTKLAPIFVQLH